MRRRIGNLYPQPTAEELEQIAQANADFLNNPIVFVYGTLRKGFGNHSLLQDAEFISIGKTKHRYCMTASGCPFVSEHTKMTRILGELYRIKTVEDWHHLDRLESHPTWYVRKQVEIEVEGGKYVKAWLYFNEESQGQQVIRSGDYADYRHSY